MVSLCLMDACRVGSIRQQASSILLRATVCTSFTGHRSLITHMLSHATKASGAEGPRRIKVKSSTRLLAAPRLLPTTNLQKLIIPTDETSRPIAKSIRKQLSFATTSELSWKRLSCHPCTSKTVSPTFAAPTQWRPDGSAIQSLLTVTPPPLPPLFDSFLALP